MQEKPLQTETTAPPPTDRKGKIIYGEFGLGKHRNDNRKFRMFGTLDKVSIVDIASADCKAHEWVQSADR